ncbi:hypothetical protein GCM10010383_04750 [Streptomyces lomondensis]|uniref:Uncharacterized protein n=1 Tax=Streptomyces lomondensis TaxID=68229 RepID=A0ABQ2WYK0_9ACTN|nr:hypothetical protein GCM10010383_04750 [Streptomyces lomondensis]
MVWPSGIRVSLGLCRGCRGWGRGFAHPPARLGPFKRLGSKGLGAPPRAPLCPPTRPKRFVKGTGRKDRGSAPDPGGDYVPCTPLGAPPRTRRVLASCVPCPQWQETVPA